MENRVVGTLMNRAFAAAVKAASAAMKIAMTPRGPYVGTPRRLRRGKSADHSQKIHSVRNLQRNLNRGIIHPIPIPESAKARHSWYYRPKAAKS